LWVFCFAPIISRKGSGYPSHGLDNFIQRFPVLANKIFLDAATYLKENEEIVDIGFGYSDQYDSKNYLPRPTPHPKYRWYWHTHFMMPGSTTEVGIYSTAEEAQLNLNDFYVAIYPTLYAYNTKGPSYLSKPIEQRSILPLKFQPLKTLQESTDFKVVAVWDDFDMNNRPVLQTLLRINQFVSGANISCTAEQATTTSHLPNQQLLPG